MSSQAPEVVREMDAESLRMFAEKGMDFTAGTPQVGEGNAVKVRRVMQITRDLLRCPLTEARVLDIACGEGVYAIEAALRGAEVVAFDARTIRMDDGRRCAEKLGLTNLHFEQNDVRKVTRETHGEFDAIYFLGILYHLDVPDVFQVLENLRDMCRQFVIIDTHVSVTGLEQVEYRGRTYAGRKCREHGARDSAEVRESRKGASIDNTFAFQFTRKSLRALLSDMGFTSLYECLAPAEPLKPTERVTWVAFRGTPVQLSSYPWVNGLSEEEIRARLQEAQKAAPRLGLKRRLKTAVKNVLRKLVSSGAE